MARKGRGRAAPEASRITELLPVALTAEEVAAFADEAARTRALADRKEEERVSRNKTEREEIEQLEALVRDRLRLVRERREDRPVGCEERIVFERNAMVTTRLDTGEVVRERPLTFEERQGALFEIGEAQGE